MKERLPKTNQVGIEITKIYVSYLEQINTVERSKHDKIQTNTRPRRSEVETNRFEF